MGIFDRVSDLLKANVNDLIDRAEQPDKMVKQIIIDMEAQVAKATQGLGVAMGSYNQVKKQLEQAQEDERKWTEKAKACLSQGEEELAKKALENKVKAEAQKNQYQEMVNSMGEQVQSIKDQIMVLKQKLEEARSKQAMLIARDQMADAKSKMSKAFSGVDPGSAFKKMEKMEQKIAAKEAQADAFSEIGGMESSEFDEFERVEKNAAVDSELEKLKREMGL
ncbi:MAG: PspA/IM30 family protein [Filifactor alocis]|nr:PspA/IM30 family protein [Filifactor alocis]